MLTFFLGWVNVSLGKHFIHDQFTTATDSEFHPRWVVKKWFEKSTKQAARWAPTSHKWSYNPSKWRKINEIICFYFTRQISGVITYNPTYTYLDLPFVCKMLVPFSPKDLPKGRNITYLGGGFTYFLFSPLFGDDSPFD